MGSDTTGGYILFPPILLFILLFCVCARHGIILCCILILVTTLPAIGMLIVFVAILSCVSCIYWMRQKTRNPQQRRMYVGTRGRPSLGQNEPAIFVSPSNLPPPPKYECMAPPSYEEVVGVHYPNYPGQPITQPITNALAQSTSHSTQNNETRSNNSAPETVITVSSEATRPDVTVARS